MAPSEIRAGATYRGEDGPDRTVRGVHDWNELVVSYHFGAEMAVHVCSLRAFADWAVEEVSA